MTPHKEDDAYLKEVLLYGQSHRQQPASINILYYVLLTLLGFDFFINLGLHLISIKKLIFLNETQSQLSQVITQHNGDIEIDGNKVNGRTKIMKVMSLTPGNLEEES